MIIQITRRVETAATELLTAVGAGTATCDELREVLRMTRSVAAVVAATQTSAAELIARRERHGDDGAEVLASVGGLAQRDARDRVKVARAVRQVPELHEAVQSGDVSQANARRLADVITRTGSNAVAADSSLLKDAQSMRPEQFVSAANRWIASQQGDNGVSQHAQQRAKRYLKFYDTPEGMIALHGEFDKITGQRLHNRLRQTAIRLLNADKQLPKKQRRKFPQCMADALDLHSTAATTKRAVSRSGSVGAKSNEVVSGSGSVKSNEVLGTARTSSTANKTSPTGTNNSEDATACDVILNDTTAADNDAGITSSNTDSSISAAGGSWQADITVLARVDDSTRDLIYELSDGSRLPPAVVEELTCNARLTGLVYDRRGDALWRTRSRRSVSETQWQALLATYGGCFHCGAGPSMCQAHHITPFSQGGATSLDNLIMVCWNCHHRIHHDNWQIHKHADGSHTLHPPQHTSQPRHGPAHADDWPPHPAASRQTRKPARSKHETRAKYPDPNQPKPKTRNSTRSRSDINARDPAIRQREKERRSSNARDPATPATLW